MKTFLQSLLDLFTSCLVVVTIWLIIRYPNFAPYFYILFGICLLLFHISKFLFFEILVLFTSIFTGFLYIFFLPLSNNVIIIGEILSFVLWYILLVNIDETKEKKFVLLSEKKESLEKKIGEIEYNISSLRTEIQNNFVKTQNYKIVEEIINKLSSFTTTEQIKSYLLDIFGKMFPRFITKIYISSVDKQIDFIDQSMISFSDKNVTYVSDLSKHTLSLEQYKISGIQQIKEILIKNNINSFICFKLQSSKQKEIVGYLIVYSKHRIDEDSFRLVLLLSPYIEIAISNAMLYENIKELAITDTLTGLYVQRYFKELLTEKIKIFSYYKKPLSMAMFDIDNFKQINDTYGHNVGDETLIRFANILTTRLRETDIISRYGGDEFAIIFPNTDLNNAKNICEEIRDLVLKETIVVSKTTMVTGTTSTRTKFFVSCGVSLYSEKFKTAEEFIDHVDKLLYKAKQSGKNKVVWE
jgi:diguanylate cyclase (GGDEF)-like protein